MTKKQLENRVAWLEYLVSLAKRKADEWRKEKEALLQQWEKAVAEIKYWKNKYLSLKDENRSLRAENLLLKENLREMLELMEKYDRRINRHNLFKPISNSSNRASIERSISDSMFDTIEKENASESILETKTKETKVETSFDIRIRDSGECLKRRLDLRI